MESTKKTNAKPASLPNPILGVLAGATLFATGAAALAYEVAWQRHLAVLVGVDHAATAVTLAVFLGGLSLGYALCGRGSERSTEPLRSYAVLELVIGCWGLAFPMLFAWVEWLSRGWSFSRPFGMLAGAAGAAVPLILVPALLMGATVPFMTRGLASSLERLTRTHAHAYGVNTLGAVFGALVAGFMLVPRFGPDGTVRIAATVNLLAAAVLWWLSRRRAARPTIDDLHLARPAVTSISPRSLAAIALLSGVATMAQENALIRLLGLVLGGTPTLFCLIVSVFVAAIAIGSLVVARSRSIAPRAIWQCCSLSCLLWLVLFTSYDSWPWLAHLLRFGLTTEPLGYLPFHLASWLLLMLVLLLPVAPLGAVLPLIFHHQRASLADSGKVSGRLLAWNALGALCGCLGGGVLLYAVAGLPQALLAGPAATAVMAWLSAPAAGRMARPLVAGLGAAVVLALLLQPGFDRERIDMGTYRYTKLMPGALEGPSTFHEAQMINRRIVHHEDDPLVSIAVVEVPAWDLPLPRPLSIFINGKSDSNTLTDRETLQLSAHLPLLLSRAPSSALVIGQGTGVTAGELTLWPELRTIDLVEVAPAVARSLPRFKDHTHDVSTDPRLRLHVQDVRHFLRSPGPQWDVIVSEPSNLWVSGNDLLFTIEFFRSLEARLADGGVLLQWLHLYETDQQCLCSVVATMATVFPHAIAFRGTANDWLVIASREPLDLDGARLEQRLAAHPEVARSMAQLEISATELLTDRLIDPFPYYVERARAGCAIHTALGTQLSDRAARALFERTILSEPEVLGGYPAAAR